MAGIQAKENPGILNWPGEFLQEFHGCTIIGTLSTRRPSRQCWQKFLARTQESRVSSSCWKENHRVRYPPRRASPLFVLVGNPSYLRHCALDIRFCPFILSCSGLEKVKLEHCSYVVSKEWSNATASWPHLESSLKQYGIVDGTTR